MKLLNRSLQEHSGYDMMESGSRVTGCVDLYLILHRMGVMLMDNNRFDFKDLMSFVMFILALLTFILTFTK